MDKIPVLNKFPVYLKLLTLGVIVLSSMLFVLLIGIILAVPFYGADVMQKLSLMNSSSTPEFIAMAKYFQIVSQFGTFLIPCIFFAFLDGGNIGRYLNINIKPKLTTLVLSSLVILALIPVINFIAELNQYMSLPSALSNIEEWMRSAENKNKLLTENFLYVNSLGGLLVNVVMIGVLAAVGEEFLFRGILQKLFHQWFDNIHIAVILSALLFSAIHIQFFGFFPRFFMGILLGYTFVWSGSLWIPICIHFVNNVSFVIVSYFAKKEFIDNFFETVGTGQSAFIPVLLSVFLSTVMIYMIYKIERKSKSNLIV